MIIIENALVLRANGMERGAVVIDGDRVQSVGTVGEVNGARVIDAGGAWLGPGLVDLHVHFRDPGETWKEDFETGARSASAGGYTAVVAMPNTIPPVDRRSVATDTIFRAAAIDTVHVVVAGTLTRDRRGEEMSDLDSMYDAGIRIFTDDGDSVRDAGLLRRIMSYLADRPDALVAEHPEDAALAANGHLHEGEMSALHGIVGLPGVAEDVIVARDIAIARDTGARIHIQHVSTEVSVNLIQQARDAGVMVTAEVTPHHLVFDQTALIDLEPNLKMYPPLRPATDREAVTAALREGIIDAVATDHAPHTAAEKAVPFEEAPRGVIGLETAAAATNVALEHDPVAFFDRMSRAPSRIAGLTRHGIAVEPGAPANLLLFDPDRRWVSETYSSKSSNSPFTGMEMVGRVLVTINEGRITYESGMT
jgi:dihydroorotase